MTPKKTKHNSEGLLEIRCCHCAEWKLSIDFGRKKSEKRTGRSAWCLDCLRAYGRAYHHRTYSKSERKVKRTKGRAELVFIRMS